MYPRPDQTTLSMFNPLIMCLFKEKKFHSCCGKEAMDLHSKKRYAKASVGHRICANEACRATAEHLKCV